MGDMTYEEALEAIAARLSPRSLGHCERVAAMAAELAERFGVDVGLARLAGLLHDWGRDLPPEGLLVSAEKLGVEIDDVDRHVPYLLHAEVSAAELRETFPALSGAVLDAVACHTFGRVGMTALDKVVYIADTIEPARDLPGVADLRAMAAVCTLDELFVSAYARSITSLIERHRPIHPGTATVWNWIVTGGGS
jgi:predicted HD superfamily hydrolase involved in NAD metabolism